MSEKYTPKIHWLVYETHPHANPDNSGSYIKLKETASKRGWTIHVLGAGKAWKGFSSKWLSVTNYIYDKHPEDIILITDARDVLANRNKTDFINTLNKITTNHTQVVFGCEIECCVGPMIHDGPGAFIDAANHKRKVKATKHDWTGYRAGYSNKWYNAQRKLVPSSATNPQFSQLNGGLACGRVVGWRKALDFLFPLDENEDDQALWTDLYLQRQDLVTLDYNQELLSNSNRWEDEKGCFYRWVGGRWKNTRTNTFPFAIQTPGAPDDEWYCYFKLYKKLK